jgi:glycosyltransferase involved in cell wall biosynthesis
VIGFVGGVTRRALDHGLLRHAFAALRDCRFVFVGSYDASSERAFVRAPNATLLGARDYSDIPSYLAAFDVAIIPYVVGGQIDYVYPKKLHEYLAAGKPVVATDLPELRPFEGIIRIGRSPDEFVRKIEGCLQENADAALSARLAAERMALAKANTWEHRVNRIVELLDAGLPNEGLRATPHLRTAHHA